MDTTDITIENIAEIVIETFGYCLSEDFEKPSELLNIDSLDTQITLNVLRLEERKNIIIACLKFLPDTFSSSDYGDHFSHLGNTKTVGVCWTYYQIEMEMLMIMAIGLNLMEYSFPRNEWSHLPDKKPYLKIKGNNFKLD